MEIELTVQAKNDWDAWKKSGNVKILSRINALIIDIQNNPYKGLGKPEALKYKLSGKWSRRISKEDRLTYAIIEGKLFIYSLKGHY
jgi:toxin YoeB